MGCNKCIELTIALKALAAELLDIKESYKMLEKRHQETLKAAQLGNRISSSMCQAVDYTG